jgi:hypothetical protein
MSRLQELLAEQCSSYLGEAVTKLTDKELDALEYMRAVTYVAERLTGKDVRPYFRSLAKKGLINRRAYGPNDFLLSLNKAGRRLLVRKKK